MGHVVTIEGQTPPVRADGNVWAAAELQEAALRGGPFTTIETFALDPADASAAAPGQRAFTSEAAQLADGWYRIRWVDADGDTAEGAAIAALSRPAWAPVLRDIGALLRARTKDTLGNELGTFTSDTRPTASGVLSIMDTSLAELEGLIGRELPGALHRAARTLASYRTAQLVEASYFPEQVAAGRSVHDTYRDLFSDALPRLLAQLDATDDTETGAHLPRWSFPDPCVVPTTQLGRPM